MKKKKSGKMNMEKTMTDLSRLLESRNFKSQAELKKFMESIMDSGDILNNSPLNNTQVAQDMIYDAWDATKKSERIRLAKKALSLWPDCADAYNLLAEDAARSLDEVTDYYRKGMDAGRRALGEEVFKDDYGHFWGLIETRPYMRSRIGLMQCLWAGGKHEEAIRHANEMLKLNPNDNQGIRYILVTYLTNLERYDELDKFINKGKYKGDVAAEWLYTRVLVSFVKTGASKKTEKALAAALEMNSHVPEYLTGKKPIPRFLPDAITWGGEDEAFCYAATSMETWKRVPGAIDWLKETTSPIRRFEN